MIEDYGEWCCDKRKWYCDDLELDLDLEFLLELEEFLMSGYFSYLYEFEEGFDGKMKKYKKYLYSSWKLR